MKNDLDKNRIRINQLLWLSIVSIWIFYMWILSETPYEIDDWSWGISEGWHALVTGELNGRYLSNLLEVIVSRSPLMKTLFVGTMAMLMPLLATVLCLRFTNVEDAEDYYFDRVTIALPHFLFASLLFLTLPIPLWRQTYGWIAGFSNFGFSGIILLVYQGVLLRALWLARPNSKTVFGGVFLFGAAMQLVLENVTIYVLVVSALIVLEELVRKRRVNILLTVLLLGNMTGTVLMFSGSIYHTLMESGHAINGMRAFKLDRSISLWDNLLLSQQRFVYFFPQSIWSNNWVLTASASLLLAGHCWKKNNPIRIIAAAMLFFFAAIFIFMRCFGPLELFIPGWSDVLTQRLNLLFFWFVAALVIVLWRNRKRQMAVLLFLWFSAPGVILPLSVTNMNAEDTRCFLTSAVFLIEFCLLLSLDGRLIKNEGVRNTAAVFLAIGVLFCCAQKLIIYHGINTVRLERAELVQAAQRGETDRIDFPDFPHWEYLWVTEPIGESQRSYFRAFYRIPDEVSMHFNTGEENE